MESSTKILNNYDVLQLIFRYLDFKDHLKLIKICSQFEDAILHGVWRLNYKNLYIAQIFGDTFRLQYNPVNDVMTKRSLTAEAIYIILQHTSMYIHKLELNDSISCLENIISVKYHNLTELSLRCIVVEDTHLQQVAENCINLQSLSLINFTNAIKHSNIRSNVFGEMKALNKLEISDIAFHAWNYFDIQHLFCLTHLKTLIININTGDSNDNKGKNNTSTDRVYNIENLTIGELPCLQCQSICFIQDLIRFENLTKLSLKLKEVVSVDDNVLTQINNPCPKLCELSFVGCVFDFKEFPRMNNLMHLTFERCSDISLKNVDEIFRKLKLKSLSLVSSVMCNEVEHFSDYNYISNTLETLNIADVFDRNIVGTFFNPEHKFENVSKVRLKAYLEDTYFSLNSTELCFSHNFPNLQELIMDSFYISSEDILYLKHLKVLQFDLFDNMSWSYLEILFKHPTLTHITITPFSRRVFKNHCERLPCEGLTTTTLEYLSLPAVVYESGSNFWPCFRQRNKLLKLEIFDDYTSKRKVAVPAL